MDCTRAYHELACVLNRPRRLSHQELGRRIGEPPAERTYESLEGLVRIEVCAEWQGVEGGLIRLKTTASGPSWWRLDRLEETITVKPPDSRFELQFQRVGTAHRSK